MPQRDFSNCERTEFVIQLDTLAHTLKYRKPLPIISILLPTTCTIIGANVFILLSHPIRQFEINKQF